MRILASDFVSDVVSDVVRDVVSDAVSVLPKFLTLGLGKVLISFFSFLRLNRLILKGCSSSFLRRDHLILKPSFEPTLMLLEAISSGQCEYVWAVRPSEV